MRELSEPSRRRINIVKNDFLHRPETKSRAQLIPSS